MDYLAQRSLGMINGIQTPRPGTSEKTLARWTRSLLSLSSPQCGFPEIRRLQVRTCWSYLPSTGKKRLQRRWSPYWTRSCRLAYLRRGASSGVRRSQQSRWVLKGEQSCLDMRFPSFLFTSIIQIHLTLCKVSISFLQNSFFLSASILKCGF